MKYRRLDKEDDMTFGQGKYNYLIDEEAVSQAIFTKLKFLQGEWWESIDEGTPVFQKMLVQNSADDGKNAIDIIIKTRILEVQGVESITAFDSYIEDKIYKANIDINTIYGDITDIQIEF